MGCNPYGPFRDSLEIFDDQYSLNKLLSEGVAIRTIYQAGLDKGCPSRIFFEETFD